MTNQSDVIRASPSPSCCREEADQLALEAEMFQLGADRQELITNNRRAARMESLSKYGEALTAVGVDKVVGVLAHHRRQMEQGKAGRTYAYLGPLLQLSPKKAAATAARVVLDQITHTTKLHALAYHLADMLWMETMLARATVWERKHHAKVRGRLTHKQADVRRMQNTVAWTPQERLSTGVFLVHLVAEHTGLIEVFLDSGTGRRVKCVRATQACMEWIRQVEETQKALCPFSLPMVLPPRDWLNPYEGGYFTEVPFNTLLKSGNEEAAEHCTGDEAFVVAANLQQTVAYRINGWLLEQVQHAWDKSLGIGCLLPREGYEIPPYPKHLPDDHPDVAAWRFNARQLHEQNDRSRNRRIVTAKQLWIARRFLEEPAMYFPMQLDFRGRYYYRPPFVNPQGNDVGRGLLLFANGTPIRTEREADWLRVHGANLFGHSKLTWQARLDWVHQHQLQIEAAGRDPWGYADWWTKASDPWQFLSFCREYQQFSAHGYGYISHLPVVLDCTCSGIQHYAALLRSEEMAELVNLKSSETPQDIYTAVLAQVLELLRNDAAAGDPHAQSWLQLQPDRTLAKPVVMTLPYSATRQAVFHFCQQWAFERTLELYGSDGWCFKKGAMAAMHYMATILYRETSKLIAPAKEAMTWLKRVGQLAGEAGVDLHWTSPSGLHVHHKYMDFTGTRIRLYHLSSVPMELLTNHIPKGLNPKRMGNGLSPNVIHSLDASHMAFATITAFHAGVRNLGGIHDCFATTAAEMDTVRDCVRNSFADLYSTDWFTLLADELLQQLPPDLLQKLPTRPTLGGLDVNHVRNANYFIT